MLRCDLDFSVPDWIIEHPESLAVFQQYGIDYCCGGKSLAFACQEQGVSPSFILARIEAAVGGEDQPDGRLDQPMLASIQVGMPRTLGSDAASDPMDRQWTTGFFKEPVQQPVQLGEQHLAGDGQADRVHHGGPDKAVLAYAARHYQHWREALENPALPFGAFGENFTVEQLTEADVCIGDTWQIGESVRVQVSQPRQPCWKLARRWRIKTLAWQVQQSGRTGWYFRVLQTGVVAAGMPLTLLDRPHPAWTVEQANQVMHAKTPNTAAALELASLPLLSENWRTTLARRAAKQDPDSTKRLIGENADRPSA